MDVLDLEKQIHYLTDIDKTYLFAKDPQEGKYQFPLNKQESIALSILMIQNLLLYTQIIWMIIIKTLQNTIQIASTKY